MPNGFLPNADVALVNWSQAFLSAMRSGAAALDLTPSMIAEYADLDAAFAAAVTACDPAVRTRIAVNQKGVVRAALRTRASQLARRIASDPAVTAAQKIALGLNVPASATRLAVPETVPLLRVGRVEGRTVSVVLSGPNGTRRSRPGGTSGAILFHSRTADLPGKDDDWCYAGLTSATAFELTIPGDDAFDRVYLTARWLNPRLQSGPACRPVIAYLQPQDATPRVAMAA